MGRGKGWQAGLGYRNDSLKGESRSERAARREPSVVVGLRIYAISMSAASAGCSTESILSLWFRRRGAGGARGSGSG